MRRNLAFWPILLIKEDMPSRYKTLKWGAVSVSTILHFYAKPQNNLEMTNIAVIFTRGSLC